MAGADVPAASPTQDARREVSAFKDLIRLFTRHGQLTLEMARREISDRYLGQVGGAVWALAHPLVLVAVYVFVFAVVFRVRLGGAAGHLALDYPAYLLSGLIPWLGIQETLSKASTVIVSNSNLVKQVVFPLEVLPVKVALATLATQTILIALLFIYIVVRLGTVPRTIILLPVLLLLQALLMFGIAYVIAGISPYFRDVKDFVQVFAVIGAYLLPAFYLPESVPRVFRPVLYVNPFSHLVWCYQDVFFFGRIAHPWSWGVLLLLSLCSFYGGFRLFRLLRTQFGNVL